ncbi:FHA domain-containing protein [Streptomyces sp. LZ34]
MPSPEPEPEPQADPPQVPGPADTGPADTRPDGIQVSAPCWNCRAPVAPRDPRCASCDSTRTHVLLVCSQPCLELRHGPGPPLNLGRHPTWAPRTAADFADWRKVSRRHASITVEPDGRAWAEEPPEGSHNGTFVNGAKLMPGVRTPLRDGDQLRLGLRISIAVRLYGPEPPRPGTG